ncbi:hypothetical protein EZV61_15905 [Corallincola luteus]|uniref:Lipocalin-like domain-containing protein n=1 Tax=Corallincola luteus TaxID=1775177 RepID=A0ABY2AIW7_9GAMM|nr:hypothetical protein [Corallincola luteus]TCI02056.1 hypothetical protein EZV61_15905 [Corallincola luteus]
MTYWRVVVFSALIAVLTSGCATQPTDLGLKGEWQITLLDGNHYPATIQQLSMDRVQINCASLKLSGEYEFHGSALTLAKADAKRVKSAYFEKNSMGNWTVMSASTDTYLMPHLLGAQLVRIN